MNDADFTCDQRIKMYKAVALRSYARAAVAAPSHAAQILAGLEDTAKLADQNCKTKDNEIYCKYVWDGKHEEEEVLYRKVSHGGMPEVITALEAVQGILMAKSKEVGNAVNPLGESEGAQTGAAKNVKEKGAAGRVVVAWAGVGFAGLVMAWGMM